MPENTGNRVTTRQADLVRIAEALKAATDILKDYTPGAVISVDKGGRSDGNPLTEADTRVNNALRKLLHIGDDGWLSEETRDDLIRLEKQRVWVVDPLDGTKEFVTGIPEWSVSIGLVEDGIAVAGGICNPQTNETIIGSRETGVTYNGGQVSAAKRTSLDGAVVLASRSEIKRGEWQRFEKQSFSVKPTGSVAYKFALTAAGQADATWTLCPKNEWDVAAGVALVIATGGFVVTLEGKEPRFNNRDTLFSGLIAGPRSLAPAISDLLAISIPD